MHMKSKQSYLRKMKMILSFFYKEEDVKSIIYDYEEQFELAKKCGNMTEIQGSSLKSPWKECQKILAEEGTSSFKAFIAQKKFKILFLILLFILSSGYIVTKCERGGISFLFPALGINFLFYIIAWLADGDGILVKQKYTIINILLLVYACVECFIIGLYVPVMVFFNVGATIVCVINAIATILVLMLILIIIKSESIKGYYLFIHHVAAIVLCTLYCGSQMHIMQDEISIFSFRIISGVICIYCESIILYLFRMGVNRFTKKYGRTIKTWNT